MEFGIERAFGHFSLLTGPIIDQYFQNIGRGILSKLSIKHLTGYVLPLKEFAPRQIFSTTLRWFAAYRWDPHDVYLKRRRTSTQLNQKARKIDETRSNKLYYLDV